MHELDVQLDQRNVAIAVPIGPVNVSLKYIFENIVAITFVVL